MPPTDPTDSPTRDGEQPLPSADDSNADLVSRLLTAIKDRTLREWYRDRQRVKNIREGQAYFNGPTPTPPPERHTPNSLLQCHRKIAYRQATAPNEQPRPEGIYWTGDRFETELVVPYLQDLIAELDCYIRNSIWIDTHIDTPTGSLHLRGATDPCVVDCMAKPLAVSEVKTKDTLDHLTSPDHHHRAQVHAYMRGLSAKFDREITDAFLIYGSRQTLASRVFHEPFDPEFWKEVRDWAIDHTKYREKGDLPPAQPKADWECGVCSYRHRCGQTDYPYADVGTEGFLPLQAYPRERVHEYLDAHEEGTLTPTLAHHYPELAAAHEVADWHCSVCGATLAWDADSIDWDGNPDRPPSCPVCDTYDGRLRGPDPPG